MGNKSSSGGKSKKGRRSAHNKQTGKYTKQRVRTEANKRKKRIKHIENNPNDEKNKKILKERFHVYI